MKCPKCGTSVKSSQQTWQEQMRAQGKCIQCGHRLNEKLDKRADDEWMLRCRGCRIGVATRAKNRYRAKHPNSLSS